MTALPAALRKRPQHKGLPVPYVNETDDGAIDFSAIYAPRVLRCAQRRLCGLCGKPLAGARGVLDCAFLGGPRCAESRTYTDPPMHRACAEMAVEMCCHVSRSAPKRRPGREDDYEPAAFVADKPSEWIVYRTTSFDWSLDEINGLVFRPRAPVGLDRYAYDDEGVLRAVA